MYENFGTRKVLHKKKSLRIIWCSPTYLSRSAKADRERETAQELSSTLYIALELSQVSIGYIMKLRRLNRASYYLSIEKTTEETSFLHWSRSSPAWQNREAQWRWHKREAPRRQMVVGLLQPSQLSHQDIVDLNNGNLITVTAVTMSKLAGGVTVTASYCTPGLFVFSK